MYSCLKTMDSFLQQSYPILASMVLANKQNHSNFNKNLSLSDAVAKVLGIKNIESININQKLIDFGMDSLMSTEIRQIFEINFNCIVNTSDIRNMTFKKLIEFSSAEV